MTPAENLRAAVEERWPAEPALWAEIVIHDILGGDADRARAADPGAISAAELTAGALRAARSRRATALSRSGLAETPESEREVPIIRALAAFEIAGAT